MSDSVTGADAQVRWNRAVRLANEEDDTTELVDLLLTLDVEMTTGARKLIADLIARHRLAKKRGGQQLPKNRRSMREMHIASAVDMIRRLKRERDWSEPQALTAVAECWGLDEMVLGTALDGQRGSANRERKRQRS